jgi:hypothetical protein
MIAADMLRHHLPGHDVVTRCAESVETDEDVKQVVSHVTVRGLFRLPAQHPLRATTLTRLHLYADGARRVGVGREDIDAPRVPERDRRHVPRRESSAATKYSPATPDSTGRSLDWGANAAPGLLDVVSRAP